MSLSAQQLRELVRDVLRDTIVQKPAGLAGVESVRITNDVELMGFVQRVIAGQDAIKAGKLKFTLGAAPVQPVSGVPLQGVITEQIVDRHANAGTLQLAADAVITPLGRDRARKLGLRIERRR